MRLFAETVDKKCGAARTVCTFSRPAPVLLRAQERASLQEARPVLCLERRWNLEGLFGRPSSPARRSCQRREFDRDVHPASIAVNLQLNRLAELLTIEQPI